ncbi:MAG: HAD-IIIA family hydrolase [Saprospiraceae bacterium]|nr:HAD-IIIA family hydrolase [Saprospiraceae bacterium]
MDNLGIEYDLKNAATIHNVLGYFNEINTFVFDVDGVMTDGKLLVTEGGEFLRSFNARDGYAIRLAIEAGYNVCVISGGRGGSIEHRMKRIGIRQVFTGADPKLPVFLRYCEAHNIDPYKTLYMGDDLNDLDVMKKVGLACCPTDACPEIIEVCHYVSPYKGGDGCVRDVVEKVMKLHDNWNKQLTISE